MLDKDKLILVVYFGVQSMNTFQGNQIMIGWAERLKKNFDDSVKTFVIPQRNTNEIKMEILNVKDVSEDKIDKMTEIYNKLLKEYENSKG